MAKKKKSRQTIKNAPEYSLTYGRRTVHFIADKVLIFRFLRKLHGRFWGLAAALIMLFGFALCFMITPEILKWSTALSDFGRDVRTAPYLAGALFFGAYGLWRWRNYLRRTLKHSRPVTSLVTLTVLGLYIAALMPVALEPIPYHIHIFGVALSGISMAATVVLDTLLTRVRRGRSHFWWRSLRVLSFFLIVIGGYITFGSTQIINKFQLALLGEAAMFAGYFLWIFDKTYRGEGSRSQLSKLLRGLVLID